MTAPPPAGQYPAVGPTMPAPPPANQGTDGFAIASLVLGLLGGGVLALIFGLVARSRIKKNGTAGRGMATAGIVLGILGILGLIAVIVFVVLAVGQARDTVAGQPDTVGQCFTIGADGALDSIVIVDCATPHNWEIIAVETMTDDALPDAAAIEERGNALCIPAAQTYFADDVDLNSVGISTFHPTPSSWLLGDRILACIAGNIDGSLKTGSLAG